MFATRIITHGIAIGEATEQLSEPQLFGLTIRSLQVDIESWLRISI